MNKTLVLGLGVAGGAAIFWAWRQRQKTNTSMGIPAPNGSAGTSPANSGARVDNQNQPWYLGSRSAMGSKLQEYQNDPTKALKDGQSIIHSAADVWGTVSGWFSGDQGSNGSADDWNESDNYSLPSSGEDQSNLLGAEIGKFDQWEPEPVAYFNDSDSVDWTLDYSDSNAIGSDNYFESVG